MSLVRLPPLSAFQALFDAPTWRRGEAYARDGQAEVIELVPNDPEPGWWSLEADVEGSADEPYEVSLTFQQAPDGHVVLESECTCPVGLHCKHTVAALVEALSGQWADMADAAQGAGAPAPAQATSAAALAGEADEPDEPDGPSRAEPAPAAEPSRKWPWAAQAPVLPPTLHGIAKEHEPLERWLRAKDLLRQRQATHKRQGEAPRQVYVLSSEPHDAQGAAMRLPGSGEAHWLCLWPAKVKPLKSKPDQWGKPILAKTQYGRLFSEGDGHGEVFQMMRRWLLGQASATHSWGAMQAGLTLGPASAVQDAIGLQVLQAALQTGDVVTLNETGHIAHHWQWGEPRAVNWTWRRDAASGAEARWHAQPDLGSPHCALRLGAPAFYLDLDTHTVGLVQTPQTAAQLAEWLTLPPLPEDWMRERAPSLLPWAPPLPTEVVGDVVREVSGVAPVPHLRVGPAPAGAPGLLNLHLSFDYDGSQGIWPAEAATEQWVRTAQGRVLLHRQVEAETQWLTPLLALGYQCAPPPSLPAVWAAYPLRGQVTAATLAQVVTLARQRDEALLAQGLSALRAAGFVVSFDAALSERMHEAPALDLGLAAVSDDGSPIDEDTTHARWFNLSLGFEVDGERVNLLPWLPQLLDHVGRTPPQADGDRIWLHATDSDQWWHVPVGPLRPWLATMMELAGERRNEFHDAQALRLNRFEAMRLAAADAPVQALALSGTQAKSLGDMVTALKQGGGVEPVAIPPGLNAELRPYQRQGLAWLQFLSRHQLGGVLADDMGLGKTLQTIAHLWVEKQAGRLDKPALVIAPTSLMGNWRSELNRFAPGLRTLVLHGAQRSELFDDVAHSDVVVTTYPLLSRDQETLLAQTWSIVVLDEAQTIKNARTQAALIVQVLKARQRLCLSGTPMENHLGEIWSLFNFLMPGYLGNEARFKYLFRNPIEKNGDGERLVLLRARLAPFMLRRHKALVAAELPPKVETIEHVSLAPAQAKLYETIRLTTEKQVREALSSKGLSRSHITVLDALLKLRQVCCDPRLVPLASAAQVTQSTKLDWLVQNLPEMIAEGRRVLLFSQFTSMLDLIEAELPALGLRWVKLTGQSTGREALIERFTSGEVPLFLISLKAGGVGLNLPQADTVIHYDPWWNPAVEDQATDRAHRIGQTQTVFVHKLVAEGTLEERILTLQARKAELARGLHGEAGAQAASLTENDLNWLLQPLEAGLPEIRTGAAPLAPLAPLSPAVPMAALDASRLANRLDTP